MTFIDFHTHHPSREGEIVVQDGVDTCGRHPYYLSDTSDTSNEYRTGMLAVGESGLDHLCATPRDVQLQVFREEVARSEQLQLPLYLHCVRAIDDVLRVRRECRVQQPWIWHGFRGNAAQLTQLCRRQMWKGEGDIYFSFGFHYHPEALKACPPRLLLLETDDDPRPVRLLYEEISQLLDTTMEDLTAQMQRNYEALFGKR